MRLGKAAIRLKRCTRKKVGSVDRRGEQFTRKVCPLDRAASVNPITRACDRRDRSPLPFKAGKRAALGGCLREPDRYFLWSERAIRVYDAPYFIASVSTRLYPSRKLATRESGYCGVLLGHADAERHLAPSGSRIPRRRCRVSPFRSDRPFKPFFFVSFTPNLTGRDSGTGVSRWRTTEQRFRLL